LGLAGLADRVSIAAASYVSALRQENPIGELCATGASEVKAELQVVPYCTQGRQSAAADDAHAARDGRITVAAYDAVVRLSDVDGVDARIGESRPVLSNCEVAESRSDIVLVSEQSERPTLWICSRAADIRYRIRERIVGAAVVGENS